MLRQLKAEEQEALAAMQRKQLEIQERNTRRLERKHYESKVKEEDLKKELRAMNWHLDELDRDQREQQQNLEYLNRNRKRSRD